MPPPGLQIDIRPRMTLTFDLLHPSYCNTMDIYRNMCVPDLVKIRQLFSIYLAKPIFVTYFGAT